MTRLGRRGYHAAEDAGKPKTCCFTRANCTLDRSDWIPVADSRLHVLRFATAPSAVLAGEPNFLRQSYRPVSYTHLTLPTILLV